MDFLYRLLFGPWFWVRGWVYQLKELETEVPRWLMALTILLVVVVVALVSVWFRDQRRSSDRRFVKVAIPLAFSFICLFILGGMANFLVLSCNGFMPTLTPEVAGGRHKEVCLPWLVDRIPAESSAFMKIMFPPGYVGSLGDVMAGIALLLIYWLFLVTLAYSIVEVARKIFTLLISQQKK